MASRSGSIRFQALAAAFPKRTATRRFGRSASKSSVACCASDRSLPRTGLIRLPSPTYHGTTFQATYSERLSIPASRNSIQTFWAVWSLLSAETNPDPTGGAAFGPGASNRPRIVASVPASVGSKYGTAASGFRARRKSPSAARRTASGAATSCARSRVARGSYEVHPPLVPCPPQERMGTRVSPGRRAAFDEDKADKSGPNSPAYSYLS
jgi:hypothetical protein